MILHFNKYYPNHTFQMIMTDVQYPNHTYQMKMMKNLRLHMHQIPIIIPLVVVVIATTVVMPVVVAEEEKVG